MQKYVLMSTNWPDTREFFPSKTSISFKIRHKLTLLPYMSNILCLYKQFALYFEWKCHIFGKNWCTGELTFHRWIGEIISPVFHRCTSVEYLTLVAAAVPVRYKWQEGQYSQSQKAPHLPDQPPHLPSQLPTPPKRAAPISSRAR